MRFARDRGLTGMTTGVIDPRYGNAAAVPPRWEVVDGLLREAELYWIITVRSDGRPHAVPVVGVWQDGAFAFCTGAEEQKHRNLETNPKVAVTTGSTGAQGWNRGKDVVLEGIARRVTDRRSLLRLASAWAAKYGDDWRFEVRGQEFVQLHGPDEASRGGAEVYRVPPSKVMVFGDEHGQTTYRF